MRRAQGGVKWAIALVLPVLMSACAAAPRDASLPLSDLDEEMNRRVLATNQAILRPISEVVKEVIPGPVHDRIHDLNSNLKEPRIFVNDLLQLRGEAAAHTGARFIVNSIVGIGGLFDIASREGLPQESGDFGQTLFVWGVGEGPYVVRLYLGPSTLRDAVGSVVDMVANGRLADRNASSRGDHASSGNRRHHKLGCGRPARPIESGRRCFHRFLQLYPLKLLPDAAGGAARSHWAPERRRVTGHQRD
jgi:ABC-type transporter lipoprotein component MlaA